MSRDPSRHVDPKTQGWGSPMLHLRSAGSWGGSWGGCGRQGGLGSRWAQGGRRSSAGLPAGRHGGVSPRGTGQRVPSASPQDPASPAQAEVSPGTLGTRRRHPGCKPPVMALPTPQCNPPAIRPPSGSRVPLLVPHTQRVLPAWRCSKRRVLAASRCTGRSTAPPRERSRRWHGYRLGHASGVTCRASPQPAASGVGD